MALGSTSTEITGFAPARHAQNENRPLPHPMSRNDTPSSRAEPKLSRRDDSACCTFSSVSSDRYFCQFSPNEKEIFSPACVAASELEKSATGLSEARLFKRFFNAGLEVPVA